MTTYDEDALQFNGKKFKQYPIKMKEIVVNLFSIYQDKIWLGTHNNGVFEKFNR